jgi:hypothetical protein
VIKRADFLACFAKDTLLDRQGHCQLNAQSRAPPPLHSTPTTGADEHYLTDETMNISTLAAFISKIIETEPFVSDDLVSNFFEPIQIIPPASGSESHQPLEREKDEASSLRQELLLVRGKFQEQETRMAELEKITTSERAFLQQQNEALTHEVNLMRRALDEEQQKSSSSR